MTVWQLSTLAGLAAVLGVPAGAAAGHWAWTVFAGALGVAPGTSIPVGAGLLLAVATLLAASAIGLLPGRRSARARPAELLRAE